ILEDEYKESKRLGLDCSAAEYAHKLYESNRTINNIKESQYYLKQAAESFEKCGDYSKAARHYSKLGEHKKAAECYKKASEEEIDMEYKKFYEASFFHEYAEELIQEHNRDKSYEMLSTAKILFDELADLTSNHHLKNTGIYYSREARGRLLVLDAISKYIDVSDKGKFINGKILDEITNKFIRAQEIFKETLNVCPNIKDDVKTQLHVNVAMCEFYKQFINLEHGMHPFETGTTTGVSSILGHIGFKTEKTKKYKYRIEDEFDNLEKIILEIENKFLSNHQLKAAEKARLTKYTIIAYKFNKKEKTKEAEENVEYAENILKSVYGKDLTALHLDEKIIELIHMFFYTDFQVSAPMCVAVDPEVYKNCIGFELTKDIPKKAQQNDEILFTFNIYSKPCIKKLPNLINLKLKISHIEYEKVKDLRLELDDIIHEQFLIKLVQPGINYIRVELLHEQKDCNRKIHTEEFAIDVSPNILQ
ncbi:MAG: hypothetical protein O8C68_03855, partial [Candidatus Methanoperedens sp.]|nr:hypothetical protein [Candidatus Methanoperedens sp.]